MSVGTEEIVEVCEALPPEKRSAVVDFARFLLAKEGDRRWEEIIANPKGSSKLDAFVASALAEGSAPLDVNSL